VSRRRAGGMSRGCGRSIRAKQVKKGLYLRCSDAEADFGVWKKEALFTTTKVATNGTTWSLSPSRERPPP
jgi:hypothetical protein